MSSFLGSGWSFPPRFDRSARGVAMVEDQQDIEESLAILFGTRLGERFFHPTYGLDMHDQLFEPLSTTMLTLLEERIKIAILIFEPRIQPLAISVTSPDPSAGQLQVELEYSVLATNSRYNLVFPFYSFDGNEIAQSASSPLSWTSSST
jgi:Bacteriophage baseplate protein W